jgi:hypothetical protein
MAPLRRTLALLATLTVMLTGLAVPAAHASAEGSFVAKINAERAAQGLAPVEVYWDLVDDARAHSQEMLAADELYHNPNLSSVCSNWIGLGENVGVGPSADTIHNAFMRSSGHRANILGDYNYVGVGVAQGSDELWVTVVFMKGPAGLVTPAEPDPAPDPDPPAVDPEPETTIPADATPAPESEPTPAADDLAAATPSTTTVPPDTEPVAAEEAAPQREVMVRYARLPGLHPIYD